MGLRWDDSLGFWRARDCFLGAARIDCRAGVEVAAGVEDADKEDNCTTRVSTASPLKPWAWPCPQRLSGKVRLTSLYQCSDIIKPVMPLGGVRFQCRFQVGQSGSRLLSLHYQYP